MHFLKYIGGTLFILSGLFFTVAYFVIPSLFPPFFYADFNKAKDALEQIDGVEIIDHWQHHDISLEDCGFTLKIRKEEPIRIEFYEGQDWQARFNHLDGVILSYPYNQKTNSYKRVYLDQETFRELGIKLGSLKDVLQHIERVLEYGRNTGHTYTNRKLSGTWCHIYYDLNRYKAKR